MGGVGTASTTTSPTTAQINLAILSAIEHYRRSRWYFLESRAQTFSTVASQEFYGTSDNTNIPNLSVIDELTITVNSTRYQLIERAWEYIDRVLSTTTILGPPTHYAYYAQQLRLSPIPDAVYSVRISGVIRLADLSADADTNAWTTDAEELIRARASWDLTKHVLGSDERAASWKGSEMEALARLRMENAQRTGTGRLTPTAF